MLLSEIQEAVFARAENAAGLLPIIPDKSGDGTYETNKQPYIALSIAPLENRERVYCDSVLRSGFILANVYATEGYGVNEPTKQAEKVVDVFPEGLEFDGITIPDVGDIRGTLPSAKAGWFYVSTLIYFEAP